MIVCKSERELKIMREACRITAETHQLLKENLRPGITTKQLDELAEKYILEQNAGPAFKGYRGFPATVCVAVNEQVVHGIPDSTVLKEGDIVGLDIGVKKNGFYGDAAQTLPVGDVDLETLKLLEIAESALFAGIDHAVAGESLSNISHAIQREAENHGYSVVRKYVGHGIGRKMHEKPQIPNFGPPGKGPVLKEGMTLAIEPMVNVGGADVKVLDDNWTVVTADNQLSAHFEHTVAVTDSEPLIMTELRDPLSER